MLLKEQFAIKNSKNELQDRSYTVVCLTRNTRKRPMKSSVFQSDCLPACLSTIHTLITDQYL